MPFAVKFGRANQTRDSYIVPKQYPNISEIIPCCWYWNYGNRALFARPCVEFRVRSPRSAQKQKTCLASLIGLSANTAIVSTTAPVTRHVREHYNVRNSIMSTSASNFEYFFGRSIHFCVFFLRLTWIFFCRFKFVFWERNGVRYQGFGTEQKYCSGINETVRSGILQKKFY